MNLNVLIFCDDEDDALGDYFKQCAEYINLFFSNTFSHTPKLIQSSVELNKAVFEKEVGFASTKTTQPIVIAYSHGSAESLLCGRIPYLHAEYNPDSTKDCFVYTNACFAAKQLGGVLVQYGAIVFVGFDTNNKVLPQKEANTILSICDNIFVKLFTNGLTVVECIKKTKEQLYQEIDNIYCNNQYSCNMQIDIAAILEEMAASLTHHGKSSATINDFI
jgi:hypothetical protein